MRKKARRRPKVRYTTADTSTLDGLKRAERLHASGWKCYSVGLFILWFYKKDES